MFPEHSRSHASICIVASTPTDTSHENRKMQSFLDAPAAFRVAGTGIRHVAKYEFMIIREGFKIVGNSGGFEKVRDDALRMAGARIS